jgi:Sulfatase
MERYGLMDNAYVIFASDNGGCYSAGGKNGPLRGTKGSLFEGGTKVDAFVYSPLLEAKNKGATYDNLMHVTDWFPTLVDIAGVGGRYAARSGYELDGVSHFPSWGAATVAPAPRLQMLYNAATNVDKQDFDYSTNAPFAVRNARYKLIHFFNSTAYCSWYRPETENADDDGPNTSMCSTTAPVRDVPQFLPAASHPTFLTPPFPTHGHTHTHARTHAGGVPRGIHVRLVRLGVRPVRKGEPLPRRRRRRPRGQDGAVRGRGRLEQARAAGRHPVVQVPVHRHGGVERKLQLYSTIPVC